ncbi:MAG: hypothetical protein ACT4NY_07305 [Pseudonocardiales bacterium]
MIGALVEPARRYDDLRFEQAVPSEMDLTDVGPGWHGDAAGGGCVVAGGGLWDAQAGPQSPRPAARARDSAAEISP